MAKAKKNLPKNDKNKMMKSIKGFYEDFRETMKVLFGDAEDIWKKNKFLIIVAFVAFLLYKNKQFSIEEAVSRLEKKLTGDEDEEV